MGKSTPKPRQRALKNVAWAARRTFMWRSFPPVNYSKLIQGIFLAAVAALGLWAATFFVGMHRELKALQAQEAVNRKRLADAEARLKQQEKYLDRLRRDPALVEQLLRQKLGYARGDEFVFRFEEERK